MNKFWPFVFYILDFVVSWCLWKSFIWSTAMLIVFIPYTFAPVLYFMLNISMFYDFRFTLYLTNQLLYLWRNELVVKSLDICLILFIDNNRFRFLKDGIFQVTFFVLWLLVVTLLPEHIYWLRGLRYTCQRSTWVECQTIWYLDVLRRCDVLGAAPSIFPTGYRDLNARSLAPDALCSFSECLWHFQ